MSQSDVIVFGGYGTFGRHIVRELAAGGLQITVAGRSRRRAQQAAEALGKSHRGIAADVSKFDSCRRAIAGHRVAVNAAGPFSQLELSLLDACLDANCHYVDIADDREYAARLRARTSQIAAAGLSAAYGCSSLPGISSALAILLRDGLTKPVDQARVTLFIGNRNPKGHGAVRSAAALIGRPIEAPQGRLLGFRDWERVALGPPFGNRGTLNFNTPDYDLLPNLLALKSVRVKVGFELPGVTAALGLAARCCDGLGRWLLPRLVPGSRLVGWLGSSGGQILVELFGEGEPVARGSVLAITAGQRLAALPAVYVTRLLCDNQGPPPRGAITAYDVVGARQLIDHLAADGYACQWETL